MWWAFWRVWLKFRRHVGLLPRRQFCATLVPHNPVRDSLKPGEILIVGTTRYQKWAYFLCPCGCKDVIMLSLAPNRRPVWQVYFDNECRPTVHPSVQRAEACYSHFLVRNGRVIWCGDSGVKM